MIQINIELVLLMLCVGIFALTLITERKNKSAYRNIWIISILTAGDLLSDILAIAYRGNTTTEGYYMVRIANFANFAFLYFTSFFLSYFVDKLFEHPAKGRTRIGIARTLAGFTFLLNIVNVFAPVSYSFDGDNKYYRMNGFYVNSLCNLIAIILLVSVVIELRKEIDPVVFWMVTIDILMPLIASVFQVFIYGISITNIAIGFTQILLFLILYAEQIKRIKERDIELDEYNAKLMLTQVQPHFMLNTLSTIQYLCKTDSDAAAETISDFGVYLRNNMEFATSNKPILFAKELEHIEKYVSIEKRRFGERVNVVYNIKEKDFEIPALSVQPLVENAIKHGISKKRKGGTVEISTWRGANEIHILISDDGKGYDMNQPFSTDRVHLGLSIVEDRLKRICNGTFSIASELDKGTTCEITIPIEF